MNDLNRSAWDVQGNARMSDAQRRMLNAVCNDLANQLAWHGNHLTKDDWRHMLSGTQLGWRMVPGICRGEGAPGFIFLGGSSLSMTKTMAADAITCALAIGDDPESQGIKAKPVQWSDVVLFGMGFSVDDMRRAAA